MEKFCSSTHALKPATLLLAAALFLGGCATDKESAPSASTTSAPPATTMTESPSTLTDKERQIKNVTELKLAGIISPTEAVLRIEEIDTLDTAKADMERKKADINKLINSGTISYTAANKRIAELEADYAGLKRSIDNIIELAQSEVISVKEASDRIGALSL